MAREDGYDNLIPPKHGEVRNPNGKPKGTRNRSTIIREWLEADATDGLGGTQADQITRALILKAGAGDVPAFHAIMDGAFGKIADKSEVDLKAVVKSDATQKVLATLTEEQLEALATKPSDRPE